MSLFNQSVLGSKTSRNSATFKRKSFLREGGREKKNRWIESDVEISYKDTVLLETWYHKSITT